MGFCSDGPCECNSQFVALPVPEKIAIAVLGWVANPNLGEGEAVGVGMVPLERALSEFL